jgi:hypothetical protein
VDDPFLAVHLDDLSLTALVATTHDHHFVIATDRDGTSLKHGNIR